MNLLNGTHSASATGGGHRKQDDGNDWLSADVDSGQVAHTRRLVAAEVKADVTLPLTLGGSPLIVLRPIVESALAAGG
jgi:hypothetical protein